jgi:hypothetical protein
MGTIATQFQLEKASGAIVETRVLSKSKKKE